MRRLAVLMLPATPLFEAEMFAAEVELRYTALLRILAEQLFTQDGRHSVRGTRTLHCQFAYLENPSVDADHAQLRVKSALQRPFCARPFRRMRRPRIHSTSS